MAEKVAKLGIARDKDFMFYVKDGSVWRVRRKQPGAPKGKPEQVADGGFTMDSSYIYFVDRDGDVSRAQRAVGGQKRKKAARAKKSTRKATRAAAKRKNGTKKLGSGRKGAKTGKRVGPKAIKARATKAKAAARKKRP